MAEQFVYTKFDERDRYEYLVRPQRINESVAPELKDTLEKVDKPTRIFVIYHTDELMEIHNDYSGQIVDGNIAIYVTEAGIPERLFVWCTVNGISQWKEMVVSGGGSESGNTITLASEIIDGLMSSIDFSKLKGIEAGANKYIHPLKHAATDVSEDSTHRFVKDSDIISWNNMSGKVHDHINKAVVDSITLNDINKWNAKQNAIGFTPENPVNKGVAGGYASLDSSGKIPANQLPPIQTGITDVSWAMITGKPVSSPTAIDDAVIAKHSHANKLILDMTEQAFTTALKTKLETLTKAEVSQVNGNIKIDGIERTVYAHPTLHSANMIVEETNRKFVSETEKAFWNAKQAALGFLPENSVNKGVANGYASLDASGKVPVAQLPSNFKELKVVNNLVDRDALTKFEGLRVHVINASADATVSNGWAEYLCDGTNWLKVAEGESIDVVLDWANLVGKPTSTVGAIDDATAKRHAHSNKAILDATDAAFTVALKTKVDSVTTGATKVGASSNNGNILINGAETTVYTHPVTHAASMITEDATHRFVTDSEKIAWNGKASTAVATLTANGLMSTVDKAKIDGIQIGANNYVHPDTHSIDIITETVSKKIMTYDERLKLANIEAGANNYVHPSTHSLSMITETATLKIMTASERAKLTNVEEGANKYIHPINHDATMILEDSNHRFVTDYEKTSWNAKASTAVSTKLTDGLMAAADKVKLDSISSGANKVDGSINNGFIRVDGIDTHVYSHPDFHDADMIVNGVNNKVFTSSEKLKLNGITSGATKTERSSANGNIKINDEEISVYTHPTTHPATMISQSSGYRFVSDTEKTTWNAKQNALGFVPESASNKGVANGYASLDSDGKVPVVQLPTSFSIMKVVNNIAERDTVAHSEGLRIHVLNATADATVTSGWAEYISTGSSWIKVAENESLDIILQWGNIQSRPTATVGDIDDAAIKKHSHANKAILDATQESFTTALKNKLDGVTTNSTKVESSAINGKILINGVETTVYTHPASHPANIITEDATHRFTTDSEKTAWNGKVEKTELLVTKVIEFNNPQTTKAISGDYNLDPAAYSESYDLSALGIVEFLWINVNGASYSHSKFVSYNTSTNVLIVKGLQLLNTDAITIAFNKKQY